MLLLLHSNRLMRPRVLPAAMDLLERYVFCNNLVRKTSFFVLRVCFSLFKLFIPDFEAVECTRTAASLCHFEKAGQLFIEQHYESPFDQTISANQITWERQGRKDINLAL